MVNVLSLIVGILGDICEVLCEEVIFRAPLSGRNEGEFASSCQDVSGIDIALTVSRLVLKYFDNKVVFLIKVNKLTQIAKTAIEVIKYVTYKQLFSISPAFSYRLLHF